MSFENVVECRTRTKLISYFLSVFSTSCRSDISYHIKHNKQHAQQHTQKQRTTTTTTHNVTTVLNVTRTIDLGDSRDLYTYVFDFDTTSVLLVVRARRSVSLLCQQTVSSRSCVYATDYSSIIRIVLAVSR